MTGQVELVTEQKQQRYLQKHVALVHSSGRLSLVERKLANILLWKAYPRLRSQRWHEMALSEICELLDYKGRNYEWIKDAARNLMSTVVEFDLLKDLHAGWEGSPILAAVRIPHGAGVIQYQYSDVMVDRLYTPSLYASLDMQFQNKPSSVYGHALYETAVRFHRVGQTRSLDLETWRRLLCVPEDTHVKFSAFKRHVIDKAVKDVNKNTPLKVRVEFERTGHAITHMKLHVQVCEALESSLTPQQHRYLEALVKAGVYEGVARNLVTTAPLDAIREALERYRYARERTMIFNPGAWIAKVIDSLQKSNRRRRVEDEALMSPAQGSLELDDEAHRRQSALRAFNNLDEQQRVELWSVFLMTANPIIRRMAERDGGDTHPGVLAELAAYLLEHHPEVTADAGNTPSIQCNELQSGVLLPQVGQGFRAVACPKKGAPACG